MPLDLDISQEYCTYVLVVLEIIILGNVYFNVI